VRDMRNKHFISAQFILRKPRA